MGVQPLRWISRSRAKYGDKNLAPFKLQLSHKSQAHSILVIKSMFSWLKTSDYLSDNPWNFVNTKTGDDLNINLLDTKSLSEKAVSEIIKYIELQPPSSACSRFKFILLFLESVGLRSTELLNARFRDIKFEPEGCFMQVYGKGAKIRVVAIPEQALNALQEYLEKRGLKSIETAPSK